MFKTLKAGIAVIAMLVSVSAFAAGLTEDSVKNFVSQIDSAISSLNANGIANAMTDDVTIVMNIDFQGKKQVMKPSKREYLAMLQQGWSVAKDYKYSKTNVKIRIDDDKALITSDVKESMTVQGRKVTGQSKEEMTIELVDGKPMVTRVVGYTSM